MKEDPRAMLLIALGALTVLFVVDYLVGIYLSRDRSTKREQETNNKGSLFLPLSALGVGAILCVIGFIIRASA